MDFEKRTQLEIRSKKSRNFMNNIYHGSVTVFGKFFQPVRSAGDSTKTIDSLRRPRPIRRQKCRVPGRMKSDGKINYDRVAFFCSVNTEISLRRNYTRYYVSRRTVLNIAFGFET